jgi:putative ABC transport system permease protein
VSGAATSLLRLLSLRHFVRHRLRTALAIASVALGVAAFLGMAALNRGVLDSFDDTASRRAGGGQLLLRGGRVGIARELADEARRVAGVRAAVPVVARVVDQVEPARLQLLLVGVDLDAVPSDLAIVPRDTLETWKAGAAAVGPIARLAGATPVVLSKRAAYAVGTRLLFATARGRQPAVVAALVDPVGPFADFGGAVVGARLDDAIAMTSTAPYVDRVELFLEKGADVAAVRERLEAVLHGRAQVADPGQLSREFDATLGSFRLALHFLSALSLLIAMFLVHSTLSMALAERRRELSIARCVGLSAAKLRLLLVLEGGAIGGVGALVGVPLGHLLARVMADVFWRTVGNTFDRIEATVRSPSLVETLLGVAAGLLAALVAVAPAAIAASRRAPLEGLTVARTEARTGRSSPLRLALAAAFAGLAVVAYLRHGFGVEHAGYGVAVALVVAIALGAHPLLALVLSGTRSLLLRTLGPAGRLARDHCERAVGPTSLTVVAISLGFGLVYSTDVLVKSYLRMLDAWFDHNVREDLLVLGDDFLTSGLQGNGADAALVDELKRVPGVLHAQGLRFSRIPFYGDRVMLFGVDGARPPEAGQETFVEGSRADRVPFARGDGVFVSEGFARRYSRGRGSEVEVPTPDGPLRLPVLAVVEDYLWPLGSIWIDSAFYRRTFHDDEVQEYAVTVDHSRPLDDVRRDVEKVVQPRFAMQVVPTAEARRQVMRIVEQYWTLLLAQEGLAVTVAFLGTFHTLLISVLLRRREIALLSALGAPRRMLGSMLRTEGVLLGLAGGVIGVAFGLATAAIVLRMLSLEEQGFAVAIRPSLSIALATVGAAGLVGWLAGVLPGRQATRVAPRVALADTMG